MTTRSKKMRRGIVLLASLSMIAAACGSDSDDTDGAAADEASSTDASEELETVKVNIGYIDTSLNGVGVIAIASELGLWEKYGIEPNLIAFTNGPTQIQAMQSGELDVGYIGGGAMWLPASGQATVIVPSEASIGERVFAAGDLGATSMEDLRGKKIGVPEGGSGEMILTLALNAAGMTTDDVEAVVLDPPSIVTAFVSGSVDAAAIFSPLADQILEAAPDTSTLAKNTDFPGTVFLGAWVANSDAVGDKPEAITRFLQVYADANDFRVGDVDQAVQYASDESGVPLEQLAGQATVSQWWPSDEILSNNADGTTFEWLEGFEEVFVTTGRLDSVTPPADFVNTELFENAMAARG